MLGRKGIPFRQGGEDVKHPHEPSVDAIEEAAKTFANTMLAAGWESCTEPMRTAYRQDARTILTAAMPGLLKQVADRVSECDLLAGPIAKDDTATQAARKLAVNAVHGRP